MSERLMSVVLKTGLVLPILRAVHFVAAFPTGTLGKILKNELRKMADELN